MDPVIVASLITVVGGGGVLSAGGWLFRNLLKHKDDQMARMDKVYIERVAELAERLQAKTSECEQERTRADEAEEKYVKVLLADIEERKSRDRTIELLSRAASKNNRGPFDEEG